MPILWGDIKAEIQRTTNTESESFYSAQEMLSDANDAKKEAEKEIVGLYDKYFETEIFLPLVMGEQLIELPTDILANKITGIYFTDSDNMPYEVLYLKNKMDILKVRESDRYKYKIDNPSTGTKIKIYPPARETKAQGLLVYYIRKTVPFVDDTSVLDVPLAEGFIKQYIKDKIKEKEVGPMNVTGESDLLSKQRLLMKEALSDMIPDDTRSTIDMNLGFYDDIQGVL